MNIDTVPAIVKELTKEEAVITMVDANLQRENLLPSEKAFAYKMKVEAMKRKAGRPPKNSSQVATNIDTATEIGQQLGESRDQVYRYIRLTYLIPELLKMVDEQRITFTPAVELSYLPEREQRVLLDEIEYTDATPSLSQAQRLRKFSNQGRLSGDTVFAVLSEEKPNQKEQVKFMTEEIRKCFPKNYSNKDMQKTILKLLENWQRKERTLQNKPSVGLLLNAKQETLRLLGENEEEWQARQLIAHKRQEQHRNSISKRKRSDPER